MPDTVPELGCTSSLNQWLTALGLAPLYGDLRQCAMPPNWKAVPPGFLGTHCHCESGAHRTRLLLRLPEVGSALASASSIRGSRAAFPGSASARVLAVLS